MSFVIKKGSKLLAIILVLLVAVSMFPSTAYANADDGKAEISVSIMGDAPEGGYEPGDTFTVVANIADNPGFAAANFNMIYDTSVLELAGTAYASILFNGIISETINPAWTVVATYPDLIHGTATATFANNGLILGNPGAIAANDGNADFMQNGKLFEIHFKVKEGTTSGDYTIGIRCREDDPYNFTTAVDEAVPVNFTGTSFSVKATEVVPEDIILKVYSRENGFSERTLENEYTEKQLKGLVSAIDPVSGMHFGGSQWTVISSNNYVLLSEIFKDSWLISDWVSGASFNTIEGPDGHTFTDTYDTVTNDSWFYPDLGLTEKPTSTSTKRKVPAVIALTVNSSSPDGVGERGVTTGQSQAYNIANPNTSEAPRILYGVTEEGAIGGNAAGARYTSRVNEITLIKKPIGADKEALGLAIDKAGALDEADYIGDSWALLEVALDAAIAIRANTAATQAQVDAATTELLAKIAALEAVPALDVDTAWYNTTDTVFNISTKAELKGFAAIVNGKATVNGTSTPIAADNFAGKTVNLTTNIDLAGDNWIPIGQNWTSDNSMDRSYSFNGIFDGNGHYIDNMTIGGTDYTSGSGGFNEANGLFGTNDGTIKDVGVRNISVNTYRRGAGIAGINYGTVTRTMSSGTINANGGGGDRGTGGIVGTNYGDVRYSYSSATVHNSYRRAGGIVGYNSGAASVVDASYFVGYASSASATYSGSIAATNEGTITNSFWLLGSSSDATACAYPAGNNITATMFSAPNAGTILAPLGANFVASSDTAKVGPALVWEEGIPTTKAVTSITATPPSKLTYTIGDSFDPTGFVPTAYYNDGTSSAVAAADISYDKTAALTVADTKVTFTVTHDGFTQTFEYVIKVAADTYDSLEITTQPSKLSYANGDSFDPAGMVVTAKYLNDTSKVVTDYTYAPTGALTPDITEIVVSYTEGEVTHTATITIEVSGAAAPPLNADGYYELSDLDDIAWFETEVNSNGNVAINGKLMNDIDASGIEWVPIGKMTTGSYYQGTFDGNGKTITLNMTATTVMVGYGVFGGTSGATIKDLTVEGSIEVTTTSYSYVGGIVGAASGGTTIENCINNVEITGAGGYIGGIAGYANGFTFTGCVNNGAINGGSNVGGIVGYAVSNSTINNVINDCINKGAITGNSTVGGIAAYFSGNNTSGITNCVNEGVILASASNGSAAGITASGNNGTKIDGCTNKGNVTGNSTAGGITNSLTGSTGSSDSLASSYIKNSANTGDIRSNGTSTLASSTSGGISASLSSYASIEGCYNSGNVSGTNTGIGGIVGTMTATSGNGLKDCYNTGSVTCESASATAAAAGIVAYSNFAGLKISNTFNTGVISFTNSASPHIHGITGNFTVANPYANVKNNYYLDTTPTDANATAVTSAELKALAPTLGSAFKAGANTPILVWQDDEASGVDKTALGEAIAAAEALTEADYTSDTWALLAAALEAAIAISASEEATQDEVNAATEELLAKIAALEAAAEPVALTIYGGSTDIELTLSQLKPYEATVEGWKMGAVEWTSLKGITVADLIANFVEDGDEVESIAFASSTDYGVDKLVSPTDTAMLAWEGYRVDREGNQITTGLRSAVKDSTGDMWVSGVVKANVTYKPEPVALTIKGGSADIEVTLSELKAFETTVTNWAMGGSTWTSLTGITIADLIANFVEDGANVESIEVVAGDSAKATILPTDTAMLAWEGYRSDREGNQITSGLRSAVKGKAGSFWLNNIVTANVTYKPEPVALTIYGGSTDIELTMSQLKAHETTVENWTMVQGDTTTTWTSLKGINITDLIENFVEDGANVESMTFVDNTNYGSNRIIYPTTEYLLAWEGYQGTDTNQITGLRSAVNGGAGNMWVSRVVAANVTYKQAVVVDKTALSEAITSAQALAEADYTSETWTPFAAALAAGITVNADDEATQGDVDSAVATLLTAKTALVRVPTTGPTVSVGSVTGAPGQTITIPVNIENNPGFAIYNLTVTFDKSELEVIRVDSIDGAFGSDKITIVENIDNANGEVILSGIYVGSGNSNNTSDGTLFNLVVKLKDNVEFGDEIEISIGDHKGIAFINDANERVNANFNEGAISVLFDRTPVAADYSFAPETNVYNGSAQGVTVTKVNALVGDVTAVYYDGSTAVPTNAGSYTISIDVAANTDARYLEATGLELGTYTITKAAASSLTIEWPTASPISLGSALSASTLLGGSTGLGSFAWKEATTIPTTAGTHAFAVVFTPNADTLANYDIAATVEGSVNVLITAEPVAADYSFTPASTVYNGSAQAVTVTKVNALVGDVTAVYYDGSETAPTNAGSYTISIDVAANTGTQYIAATGIELGTYTITKADASSLTIEWPTASPISLGSALSASTLSGGSTGLGSFAWKDGTTIPAAVGSHPFAVVFTPSAETRANYDIAATVEGSVYVYVYMQYDVTGDGSFDLFDVLLVQDYLVGRATLTPNQLIIADVDGDGVVTAADMMNLMRANIGLEVLI